MTSATACPSSVLGAVDAVVAVPVCNEVERIVDCLTALARQQASSAGVLLLVNNTTDGTVAAAQDAGAALGLPLLVLVHDFPPADANAGQARRLAMAEADRLARPGVPLLCTDADGRVAPDWLAANLAHLRAGVDAVFGQAVIDPVEAARIPPNLHLADEQEVAFGRLLDEIEHVLDPDPDDPWPRHTEHSGASIAVTRAAFARAGGIPGVALSEDRAFAAALRRVDARIRHATDVQVVVSGRIMGRAAGGMADTIRRRLVAPDVLLDAAMEPAPDRMRRVLLRRAARIAFQAARLGNPDGFVALAAEAGLGTRAASRLLRCDWFGEAWAKLDAALPRRRVPVSDLPEQTALAERTLSKLRLPVGEPAPA